MEEFIKLKRADGSIFAVLETSIFDGQRFFKVQIVEDSDWLSRSDMQRLADQINLNINVFLP